MSAPIRVALHVPPWLSIRIPAFRLVCKLRDCKLESGRCPAPEDGLPPPKGPFPRCDVPFLTATLPGYDEEMTTHNRKSDLGVMPATWGWKWYLDIALAHLLQLGLARLVLPRIQGALLPL